MLSCHSLASRICLPTLLPSDRLCFPVLSRLTPLRYYGGSDSWAAHTHRSGISAYSALSSKHPTLSHVTGPRSRFESHLSASGQTIHRPEFAIQSQAPRTVPPKQVRHPAGCFFTSGCSPPRIAATQLPSATYDVTSHGTDSHCAGKASSRTHDRRAPRARSILRLNSTSLLRVS